MNNETLLEESILKIGKVISVNGRQVRVAVDKAKNASHLIYKGDILRNISVGGYVKIVKGFTNIVGKVDGEFTNEDKQYSIKGYGPDEEKINRELNISMLGFFKEGKFERGIKELPLIDNECFLLQKEEFNQVHNFVKAGDVPLTIGSLALEGGQKISLGINSLFTSHIGIFGNTGSGKSYTLAKIYRELFEKYKYNADFKQLTKYFFLDFNGEYVSDEDNVIIDKEYKEICKLSTRSSGGDRYPIDEQEMHEPEFWAIFLEATEKTQLPFIRRSLDNPRLALALQNEEEFRVLIGELIFSAVGKDERTLEKGIVPSLLFEICDCFELPDIQGLRDLANEYRQNLIFHTSRNKYFYKKPDSSSIYFDDSGFQQEVITNKLSAISLPLRQLTTIGIVQLKMVLQYFWEIIRGYSNRDHIAPLIKRLDKRIKDLEKVIIAKPLSEISQKNIIVVSLKDVNFHTRKILPLLLCKNLYDAKKENSNANAYLNIIVDEAHNILSRESERESEQWKDYRLETFEEIIKEGRKFGVFLTIASQRPSDISPTIISQLHNYFLHRLINNNDILAIERTISYLDKVSSESLSILPTGTCILAGLLAQVPVIVEIDKIEDRYEPNNKTIKLLENWKDN